MYPIEELEPSLVASDSLLSLDFAAEEDFVGRIPPMGEAFGLPEDKGDVSTREARVNGL